jgi:lipoprotein-anchoring transpeptidase ErfK/SrfK
MRQTNSKTHKAKPSRSALIICAFSVAVILSAASGAAAKDARRNSALPADASITNQRNELIVSIPDRKLALIENGRFVKVYSVAVGTPVTPSPTGRFRIANRIVKPTYYHQGIVIGPGRGNPLGNRWMGLDLKGYGIHGTNEPDSIGHAASHGCIRMGRRDVEDLFSRVRVGDIVEIQSEPLAQSALFNGSRPKTNEESKTAAEVGTPSAASRAAIAEGF